MLTFRTTSTAMVILACLALTVTLFLRPVVWALIFLAAAYLVMLITGSARVCSGFYLRVRCKLETHENLALLTFDDGPDEKITPQVLRILAQHRVSAVFFLIGRKAEAHPELVRAIVAAGHAVGIHSYGHSPWFDFYSRQKMERDLMRAEEVITGITGERPLLFRPPYGVTNPVLAAAVKKRGYRVTGWSVRSFDTSCRDAGRVADRVIQGLHPGAVILLHDTLAITPEVVSHVIERAAGMGYAFADPELLKEK